MGEWMQFTDSELKAAIAKANELKVEMEANLPDIKRAEELKEIASNGTKLAPTHDSEYWHEEILTFREVIDTCNEALEKYDDFLKVAIEKGVAAPGVAKVQQRTAPKKFDEKLFKSKYPDLYKKYASEKIDIKGQFRITTPKDWAPDVSAFGSEQVELITDFTEMLDSADDSLDTGFALHEKHLAVLEVLQYAEWREEIADIKLRVLTGEYDGIDGTCSWKREAKTTTIFDKKSLQTEHPDEYNECVIEGKATEALIVEPKAALVGDQN
jgi:hypothetical protein